MIQRLVKEIAQKKHQYLFIKCLSSLSNPSRNSSKIIKRNENCFPYIKSCLDKRLSIQKRYLGKAYKKPEDITPSTESQSNCDGESKKWPSENRTHYFFHPETEAALNKQINAEFKAFYNYLSMAAYFGRVDVALPGCESFFLQMHKEEYDHAISLLHYIQIRGGTVNLSVINLPLTQNWKCPLHAFKTALDLEMSVTDDLVAVEKIAQKHGDQNASDYIVTNFLEDQMKSINEFAKFVSVLSGIGDQSLGRFMFDKDLLENHVLTEFNVLKNHQDSHQKKKN